MFNQLISNILGKKKNDDSKEVEMDDRSNAKRYEAMMIRQQERQKREEENQRVQAFQQQKRAAFQKRMEGKNDSSEGQDISSASSSPGLVPRPLT